MKSYLNLSDVVRRMIILVILLTIISSTVYAWKMEPTNDVVHQHITKEAGDVWPLIPVEIKEHLDNSINAQLDTTYEEAYDGKYAIYNQNDDIITGSGEEDWEKYSVLVYNINHFWNPDEYMGIASSGSYVKARKYWEDEVIPNYIKGDKDRSYYYLGRVAHLLEDAAVPAHVNLDKHAPPTDDVLEEFTVLQDYWNHNDYNYKYFDGNDYVNEYYKYEDLIPSFDDDNWKDVAPGAIWNRNSPTGLFKLFWYTAQKTQYFSSDDVSGNQVYKFYMDRNQEEYQDLPNLWSDENPSYFPTQAQIKSEDSSNNGSHVAHTANYTIPHAMKATAGLYRLFWDTVHSYSWPTYHHDNRRTGFTLLKGDMEKGKTQRKAINLVLGTRGTTAALARPSIANLDNDNYQDVVVGYLVDDEDDGWISAVGKNWWGNTKEKWKKNIGYKVLANPSIGNLDDDNELEVIVGLYNGTLILIDPDGSKDPPMRSYTVDKKYSAIGGSDVRGRLGFTAIANLDNEGRNEIIFADNSYNYDWNGTLYVLGYEGNNLVEKDMINLTEGIGGADGGAHGAVAIADVDNDDKEEIVVPGFYGIKVYDYDSGTLSLKCNNTHSYISAAPVIYDIDRDNEYEIIYTTADYDCDYGGCSNNLYVIDADSCTEEKTKSLDIYSLVSPAIANFDSDSNLEIIILGRTAEYGDYDEVQLFEYGSSITEEWTYPKSGSIQLVDSAPNIVDIDGDGDYEIIIASTTSSIMILNNTGEIFDEFDVEGTIGSTPVIGDLSGKGVAELTVKRSGSPVNILTTLTGTNRMPELNQIGDITAIAGDLININASGQVAATDPDGDNTTIYYSSPLNESGLWQTTVNDTGNYSILVEASDGNLSDYQYVDITVFSNETTLSNTFADNTTKKLLNFTGTENKTITIRLPKDAWVIHTKMKVEGMAP